MMLHVSSICVDVIKKKMNRFLFDDKSGPTLDYSPASIVQ